MGYVALMWREGYMQHWLAKLEAKRHVEDRGVEGEQQYGKSERKSMKCSGLHSSDSGQGRMAGCCECGNELPSAIKSG